MKRIYLTIFAAVFGASLCLQSCIDETIPTSGATKETLDGSPKATEALLWAMPAFLNHHATVSSDQHYDFGYGSLMRIRDVMGEDMAIFSTGYEWFHGWQLNTGMSEAYTHAQFIWTYYWQLAQTANNVAATISPEDPSPTKLGYLGIGLAFRAFAYLDMARMYEFLENDAVPSVNTAGNDVKGLTVPIVTESTTEEESRDNPRVSHEEMSKFILNDLQNAEQWIGGVGRLSKTMPDLAVVYGLYARLYMWDGNYAKAKEYARKAIDASGCEPLSASEWNDPTAGFNTLSCSSWMWGAQTMKEDDVVKTGIVNWTSWMCPEASYGYAGAGAAPMVASAFYKRIDDRDFRKLSWKAPEGSSLVNEVVYTDESNRESLPEYAAVKFRAGEGNLNEYSVGSATAFPLMRVEEMYFIEAEAAAQLNAGEGKTLLERFMQTYRFPEYTCAASDQEGVIDEIFFQKRVELWGEGQNFFDYKRLNKPVTRRYDGTNFPETARFNTTTRPAWMNFCIVRSEKNNNKALVGYENPDPEKAYEYK